MPMRTSAGLALMDLWGKTRMKRRPSVPIAWAEQTRAASISLAESQPCSSDIRPKSPNDTRLPRVAGPFMIPRWDFRNFTRLGINMAVFLCLLRRRGRFLLLLIELLALVHPALHADRSLAEDRRGRAVVDVRAQRVQRDPAQHQALLARDFRAAQSALRQQLDPLRAEVHHHLGVAAHRAAIRRAALQLLRDRL